MMEAHDVEAFVGQVVSDLAATFSGVLVNIGHKLGLYRSMAGAGPLSSAELAERTGTSERYVREWLGNQVAGGYISHDPEGDTYELSDAHAMVLANPESPVFVVPAFDVVMAAWMDEEKTLDAFRSGRGVGWHEHSPCLFSGTAAFFRTGYAANLTTSWIPALEGVEAKLQAGGRVADIGCGHGASSILIAQAYPRAIVHGFDYHEGSIEAAREQARQAGVADRVKFEVASAKDVPPGDYDLVCFMDSFHDLGDPKGAAEQAARIMKKDGTVLLVEPFAGDTLEDNQGPVARMFYAASTTFCVPNSLSQEVGTAIGAQAGEARTAELLRDAGFSRVRRATETPFNLVIEARR